MKLYQVSYNNGASYEYVYILASKLERAIITFRDNYSYDIASVSEALESDAKFLIDKELDVVSK